jgi:hypothetical protein
MAMPITQHCQCHIRGLWADLARVVAIQKRGRTFFPFPAFFRCCRAPGQCSKKRVFWTPRQGFACLCLGVPKSVKISVLFSMFKKQVKRAECEHSGGQQGRSLGPARTREPEKGWV